MFKYIYRYTYRYRYIRIRIGIRIHFHLHIRMHRQWYKHWWRDLWYVKQKRKTKRRLPIELLSSCEVDENDCSPKNRHLKSLASKFYTPVGGKSWQWGWFGTCLRWGSVEVGRIVDCQALLIVRSAVGKLINLMHVLKNWGNIKHASAAVLC